LTEENDQPDVVRDIRKLEIRVQGIETQVQELRRRGESTSRTGSKGARRRARRSKSAGPADETAESAAASEVEVGTRESEANSGQNSQLVARKPKTNEKLEDVEEVPRPAAPITQQRAITVSGGYRIPLPTTVSERDVRAVQRGISSVQNIARRVLDDTNSSNDEVTRTVQRTGSSDRWSSWLGAYSMSVARLVRDVDFHAVMEGASTRPSVRWANTEPVGKHPQKLRVRRGGNEDVSFESKNAESLLA
jgi:hypothetical protein